MIWKKIIVAMLAVSVVFSGCARHGEIDIETPAPTERVTEEPQNETLEVRKAEPYYSNIDDWYDSDGRYDSWGYSGYAKTRSNNKEEQQESAQEQNDSTMLPKRFFPENK